MPCFAAEELAAKRCLALKTHSSIYEGVFLRIQLMTLRYLDASRGSEYACVQIAPGNVLGHKYLMGYFDFLHGSRIICLPLNISEKLH